MATKSFHAGALNINMSKFDAARAVELIESNQVTVMFDFAPILASVLENRKNPEKTSVLSMFSGRNRPRPSSATRATPVADFLLHVRANRNIGHRHLWEI